MKDEDKSANCARDNNKFDNEVLTIIVGVDDIHSEWILDSACIYHMCPNKDWFSTFEPILNVGSVLGFDNSQCKIKGIGYVRIKMFDGTIRTMTNVHYILKMKRNLISLSVFNNKGYKFTCGDSMLKISKGSLVVIKVDLRKSNGLYFV